MVVPLGMRTFGKGDDVMEGCDCSLLRLEGVRISTLGFGGQMELFLRVESWETETPAGEGLESMTLAR